MPLNPHSVRRRLEEAAKRWRLSRATRLLLLGGIYASLLLMVCLGVDQWLHLSPSGRWIAFGGLGVTFVCCLWRAWCAWRPVISLASIARRIEESSGGCGNVLISAVQFDDTLPEDSPIRSAIYDVTVTMDDDLQHPPEELPKILEALTGELDALYAPPLIEQHSYYRNIASIITKTVLKGAMGAETARNVTAWRVFRTKIRESFDRFQAPMASIDVLLTWGTTRFGVVRTKHAPRKSGKSNYTFYKLVRHAFNMMTGFTVIPLQVASLIGFLITFFGACIFVYVITNYFLNGSSVNYPN